MRTAIMVVVGIGIVAMTLSGCAAASPGSGGASASSSGASSASSGGGSTASGPTGKINMCSAFTPAALSSASGKSFSDTVEADSDGVYGCAYNLVSGSGDWIVAVREPSDGDSPTADGLDLGGPSAVKPLSGAGYKGVSSPAGVELQVGNDTVEVYTPATASDAQGTTAQFVAVAKAVIAATSK